jgi:hypothetical protein
VRVAWGAAGPASEHVRVWGGRDDARRAQGGAPAEAGAGQRAPASDGARGSGDEVPRKIFDN